MSHPIKSPRKLIEVSMPVALINIESLRRKQKAPKGWPTSFHKWWAQRPLAAARAVIFGQLVNDPSWQWDLEQGGKIPPNHLKASWAKSRKRLFTILEELVLWDNSNNHAVLEKARVEIRRSWREVCNLNKDHPQAATLFNPEKLPTLHDPFAGSETIPLEAQRLGLEAHASDLNPVAVIINKALIEFPRRFAGSAPVGPTVEVPKQGRKKLVLSRVWSDATGLAEDVRRYSAWMRFEAQKRIGHLYPPVEITAEMARNRPDLKPLIGQKIVVIAWPGVRTVKSPNPAFSHVDVPLASTFILANKKGKEVYVQPAVQGDDYHFTVTLGAPPPEANMGTKLGRGASFRCMLSDSAIESKYIYTEAQAQRMGVRLMAVVAEGGRSRVYLSPTPEMEDIFGKAEASWKPDVPMPENPRWFSPPLYGLKTYGDLFTPRQLVALTAFSDLVREARERILTDALNAGMPDSGKGLDADGAGATAYAEALTVYLACVLDRMVYYGTSLTTWLPKDSALRDCMPRQALAMTWDFAECNPLGKSSGDIITYMNSVSNYLDVAAPYADAVVKQQDAAAFEKNEAIILVSTDPPYYDNIGYADLSDFFYI